MKKVEIYTDGACSGNPGPGGWGVVLLYQGHEKQISGFEEQTTNNRMEMLAAIKGLQQLKEICYVNLYSDSAYLVNAYKNGWIDEWVGNDWKTTTKKELKNTDLWQLLFELSNKHKITWIKVKGHSNNKYNEICDQLARKEVEKNKKE